MPPPPKGASHQTKKAKKKGPAPAHQNVFAFRHNPKSKTTERILGSPNVHVCRRCHDKIEWRKQYRKYKPRTQPGVCNGCKRRNVLAAYHTICTACTTDSEAAREVIVRTGTCDGGGAATPIGDMTPPPPDGSEAAREVIVRTGTCDGGGAATPIGDMTPPPPDGTADGNRRSGPTVRACAVCVKELALPDPEGDGHDDDLSGAVARIRLRERKAIERKLAKETIPVKGSGKDDDGADDDAPGTMQDGDGLLDGDYSASDTDSYEDDDPFLKAIGGADKLVTGQAYQRKLLQQQQQQQQHSTT